MICGAGDNRVAFKWLIVRSFMALGITVMSIDPPGHGDFLSVPATAHNVRVAAQAASHWLHRRSDVRRTGAMGISFGGCQAAGLCAEDERISALATISAPVELPHVTKSVVVREALSLVLPRNAMVLRHASWPQIWGEWKSMRGAWFGESLYEMIKSYDMLNTVRAIGKRPTLFIHGAADVAVPPVNAQRLYDAALPQRELMLVPQATHITVALQAREIARMAQWFSKHLA
jgi:pimeloyl-ACP methyl ester carboxylesterase